MSFLLPIAGWLGLLALPIIAFYLLKTRQRRKPVSTLLFWNQLKPKIENSPFWRKLRRWLSLALQLLIFGLILLALLRPAFDWEQKAPRRVVAVLDSSASMQANHPAPSRWQQAIEQMERSISQLRVQDEMALLTAENPPHILSGWTSSKRELRDALKRAVPQPTGTDPRLAIELAEELVSLRENARVEIFSDSVWPADAAKSVQEGWSIFGVDSQPPVNAGLTLFAIRRSPVAPGDWQLDALVTSPTAFSGTLELRRDGQPMDLTPVTCEPGQLWRKSWRGTSEGGGHFEAILKPMDGDWLAGDNQAAATLAPLARVRVLVVGNADPFLEAVLDSIPLVEWTRVDQFPASDPQGTALIITNGTQLPSEPMATALLLLNPPQSGFWGQRTGVLNDAPVTDTQKKSPLLLHAGLSQVAIEAAGQWTPAAGSEVLAASWDHPLIFGQWDRRSRWLVVGFDPGNSDLPLRTAFPVFMGNLLQTLRAEATAGGAAVLPGRVESELKPLMAGSSESAPVSVLPVFPAWWWVLLAAAGLLVLEWALFNRRITD